MKVSQLSLLLLYLLSIARENSPHSLRVSVASDNYHLKHVTYMHFTLLPANMQNSFLSVLIGQISIFFITCSYDTFFYAQCRFTAFVISENSCLVSRIASGVELYKKQTISLLLYIINVCTYYNICKIEIIIEKWIHFCMTIENIWMYLRIHNILHDFQRLYNISNDINMSLKLGLLCMFRVNKEKKYTLTQYFISITNLASELVTVIYYILVDFHVSLFKTLESTLKWLL